MQVRCLVCTLLLAVCWPSGASAAAYDLTGTWSYTNSNNWVTGSCPKGKDSTGSLTITQTGGDVTLVLTSGMVCDPASLCTFQGTVNGATYAVSNTAVVDNEGGTATNTITFTATSPTAASGKDSSTYSHPGGFSCNWGFDITLSREMPDGGAPAGDTGGAVDASSSDGPTTSADGGTVFADSTVPATGNGGDDGGCSYSTGGNGAPGSSVALFGLIVLCLVRGRRSKIPDPR